MDSQGELVGHLIFFEGDLSMTMVVLPKALNLSFKFLHNVMFNSQETTTCHIVGTVCSTSSKTSATGLCTRLCDKTIKRYLKVKTTCCQKSICCLLDSTRSYSSCHVLCKTELSFWQTLEARGGERKLAGLPVVCCWCCCCWCCCCRCCAGRCCAGCSAGAGSSAAAAAAAAGWSAAAAAGAAAAAAAAGWSAAAAGAAAAAAAAALGAADAWCAAAAWWSRSPRAGGSRTAGGGGIHKIDLINYLRFLRCVHPVT